MMLMDKGTIQILTGNNVRRYRVERKMTQAELAAKVNKETSAITRIEGGSRMMSVPTLIAVSDALNVSCDSLLRPPGASSEISNIVRLLANLPPEKIAWLEQIIIACLK